MEFKPRKSASVLRVAVTLIVIVALDVLLARALWRRTVGVWTLIGGLWLLLSMPLLLWLGEQLYGLVRLTYHLDRNKLEIRWWPGRRFVPMAEIERIVPLRSLAAPPFARYLLLSTLPWFGYLVGRGRIAGAGPAWFCVTQPWQKQWAVITPSLTYVISPADSQALLAALEERRALGPTYPMQACQQRSAFARWSLRHDAIGVFAITTVALMAMLLVYVASSQPIFVYMGLREVLRARAFRLTFLGTLLTLADLLLAIILHQRHRAAAYLFAAGAFFLQLALWVIVPRRMSLGEMGSLSFRFLLGLVLSAAIGLAAYRKRALTRSGVLGALLIGVPIFGFGGWEWGGVLIAFFISSSFLSHYKQQAKEEVAEKFAKGSRRDLGQALANGGVGALLAIGSYFWPHAAWFAAFVGVIATVTADTWATEIGVLSSHPPRLITSSQEVPAGTSGGVSPLGLGATALGALFVGVLAWLLNLIVEIVRQHGSAELASQGMWVLSVALVGGIVGSLTDSVLGATVQGIYYCDRCGKETERTVHRCGATTRHLRGYRWLTNDLVNLLSSAVGGVAAVLVARLLP